MEVLWKSAKMGNEHFCWNYQNFLDPDGRIYVVIYN
jgi:hypothetical protein